MIDLWMKKRINHLRARALLTISKERVLGFFLEQKLSTTFFERRFNLSILQSYKYIKNFAELLKVQSVGFVNVLFYLLDERKIIFPLTLFSAHTIQNI